MSSHFLGLVGISPERITIRLPRALLTYCIVLSIVMFLQLVVGGGASMILFLSLLYALIEYERKTVIIDSQTRQILHRRQNGGYTVYDFADAVSIAKRPEKSGLTSYVLTMSVNGKESLILLTRSLFPHQIESEQAKELVTAVERMVFSSSDAPANRT